MSLANWHDIVGSVRTIACIGDSVFDNIEDVDPPVGWIRRLRTMLEPVWGNGGTGFYHMGRFEWTTSGSWTTTSTSSAWDKAPWLSYEASGSSAIKTWTLPSEVNQTITSFDIYVMDGPSSGNFSYRIDGGSWTNVSHTWNQDNALEKITINATITSTLDIRAANAAGSAVQTYLAGVAIYYATPGLVIHNLGKRSDTIFSFTRDTSGDWGAFLDLVQPDLVIVEDSNHLVFFNNPIPWQVDLEQIITKAQSYSDIIFFVVPEQNNGRSVSGQNNYHQAMRDTAHAHDVTVVDVAAAWGSFATADSNGLWYDPVGVHPSDDGHIDIADRMYLVLTQKHRGALFGNP